MREMTGGLDFVLIGLAAIAGGAVNALAGGGTLITFPMLTAVGIPAVAANVTNTVALCPGYLGRDNRTDERPARAGALGCGFSFPRACWAESWAASCF